MAAATIAAAFVPSCRLQGYPDGKKLILEYLSAAYGEEFEVLRYFESSGYKGTDHKPNGMFQAATGNYAGIPFPMSFRWGEVGGKDVPQDWHDGYLTLLWEDAWKGAMRTAIAERFDDIPGEAYASGLSLVPGQNVGDEGWTRAARWQLEDCKGSIWIAASLPDSGISLDGWLTRLQEFWQELRNRKIDCEISLKVWEKADIGWFIEAEADEETDNVQWEDWMGSYWRCNARTGQAEADGQIVFDRYPSSFEAVGMGGSDGD